MSSIGLNIPEGFTARPSFAARVPTVHSDDDTRNREQEDDNASDKTMEQPADQFDNYTLQDTVDRSNDGSGFTFRWERNALPAAARIIAGPIGLQYLAQKLPEGDRVVGVISCSVLLLLSPDHRL